MVELVDAICIESSNLDIVIIDCDSTSTNSEPNVLAPDIPGSDVFYVSFSGEVTIYNKRGAHCFVLRSSQQLTIQ